MSQHTPTVTIISKPFSGWTKRAGAEVIESEVTLTIQSQSIHHEDLPAFIVRACNSHDALVKALASAKAALNPENGVLPMSQRVVAHEEVRAALKLAKEA